MSNIPKLELNLSEENEIGFKLKIEGTDKDIGNSKPIIRFVITEQATNKGWIFNTQKTDEGISVAIPSMKNVIAESDSYNGRLEVILNGRYFTPTEVDIDFIEPIKVEAAFTNIKQNKQIIDESKSPSVTDENKTHKELQINSEISNVSVKQNNKSSVQKQEIKQYKDFTKTQKEEINKLFLEKCKKYNIEPEEVRDLIKEGTQYTKKRLTSLLAASTKEYIDSI